MNMRTLRFPGGTEEQARRPAPEKLTAGIPLTQLIKPTLVDAPELVVFSRPRSAAADHFHHVCQSVDRAARRSPQVLLVTSAERGEGRSLVAANLALSLAGRQSGRVLLLEADLRHPALAERLRPSPKLGLGELLEGRTELAHVLIETANHPLHLLPAGALRGDPLDRFVSEDFEALMAELRGRYDRIVVDTPAVVPFPDADAVGRFADGALVVARVDLTRRGPFRQAIASLCPAGGT
jgi:capsular exopolysaccharide synthesis family protein